MLIAVAVAICSRGLLVRDFALLVTAQLQLPRNKRNAHPSFLITTRTAAQGA